MVYVRHFPLNVPAEQFNSGDFKNKILLLEDVQQLLANPFSPARLTDYHFNALKSVSCNVDVKKKIWEILIHFIETNCINVQRKEKITRKTNKVLTCCTQLCMYFSFWMYQCWVAYMHVFKYCLWDSTYGIWTVLASCKHFSRWFSFCRGQLHEYFEMSVLEAFGSHPESSFISPKQRAETVLRNKDNQLQSTDTH